MSKTDRPSMIMRKVRGALWPIGPYDAELFDQIAENAELTIEVKQTRSNKLNAKYWVILGRIVDNTDWLSTRALNKALLRRAGHVEEITLLEGGTMIETRSLADLDDDEFQVFYEWAIGYICTEVVPGLDRELLEAKRSVFYVREPGDYSL